MRFSGLSSILVPMEMGFQTIDLSPAIVHLDKKITELNSTL